MEGTPSAIKTKSTTGEWNNMDNFQKFFSRKRFKKQYTLFVSICIKL